MKHIKLFEQFDDDPFGEEIDRDFSKFKIVRHKRSKNLFLSTKIDTNFNRIYFYDNVTSDYPLFDFYDLNPTIEPDELVFIYKEIPGGEPFYPSKEWKKIKIDDLPEEIKDELK